MKIKNGFNTSLKIIAPHPIRLWGYDTWPKAKKWYTGPCRYEDSRIYEYCPKSRVLSSYSIYNGEKNEPKRTWTLPAGTVVTMEDSD